MEERLDIEIKVALNFIHECLSDYEKYGFRDDYTRIRHMFQNIMDLLWIRDGVTYI